MDCDRSRAVTEPLVPGSSGGGPPGLPSTASRTPLRLIDERASIRRNRDHRSLGGPKSWPGGSTWSNAGRLRRGGELAKGSRPKGRSTRAATAAATTPYRQARHRLPACHGLRGSRRGIRMPRERDRHVADVANATPRVLLRQRLMIATSAGDSPAGISVQSGSRASTDASTSDTSSPAKARRPVTIS